MYRYTHTHAYVFIYFFPGTYQFSSLESAPLGTSLGRIKANDPDVGENAAIEYSIAAGDGSDMFDIVTDKDTQEGILTIKKVYFPLCLLLDLALQVLDFPLKLEDGSDFMKGQLQRN